MMEALCPPPVTPKWVSDGGVRLQSRRHADRLPTPGDQGSRAAARAEGAEEEEEERAASRIDDVFPLGRVVRVRPELQTSNANMNAMLTQRGIDKQNAINFHKKFNPLHHCFVSFDGHVLDRFWGGCWLNITHVDVRLIVVWA